MSRRTVVIVPLGPIVLLLVGTYLLMNGHILGALLIGIGAACLL